VIGQEPRTRMTLVLVILANLISGVVAVWLAVALVLRGWRRRSAFVSHLVDFAVGTLLATALLDLVPEALEHSQGQARGPLPVLATMLVGILGLLTVERVVAWKHCHAEAWPGHAAAHPRKALSVPVILIGDGLHNLVDGVVIAAAFASSTRAGVVTSLAVMAHELPQELGDFGVLLDAGLSPRRALWWNTLSATTAVLGGVIATLALGVLHAATPYVLALSAASFLYLALADLVPSLHDPSMTGRRMVAQLGLVIAGAAAVVGTQLVLGHA
jgi:zinc and cadmium transporter